MLGLLDDHVPPGVVLNSVSNEPVHMTLIPVIGGNAANELMGNSKQTSSLNK